MKNNCFLAALLFLGFNGGAQNTFPANGYVGIGITSPNASLHLVEPLGGFVDGVIAPSKSILKFSRAGTFNQSYVESAEFRIGHGGPSVWGSRLDLYINGPSNDTAIPDMQVMSWLYNGNVGIGKLYPEAKLDINGSTIITATSYDGASAPTNISSINALRINGTIPSSSHNGITYQSEGGGGAAIGFFRGGGYDTGIDFYTNDVAYAPGNILTRMRISASGNVGIGTVTPSERLSVNGKIRAHEIKVEASNWPDYVFERGYKIASLAETESFIKANKHLPEMPSASEVELNGLELGEMNKLLLKKIEELTLHLIEQGKEIMALKDKVSKR
ncbi:hypothetical protein QWY86_15485 [Pedobacter aquatilis]|uniref:hypothetical protein n=1 Tax=Pedobacter aquatilis TaxID=351343 RepID=UPI0025B5B170|nr:hypothetical protein [Pedobacter aquatilis]MDN3588085.1 hypothetical protein [Pedobacter aquatilis]